MAMEERVRMSSSHAQSRNTTLPGQANFDAWRRVDQKFPVAQKPAVPFTIMHQMC
jgi:hypothetical protein